MNKWTVKKITHVNPNYRAWALITPNNESIAFAHNFSSAQKNFPKVIQDFCKSK